MTRTVSRLADRLLSKVVPQGKASADSQQWLCLQCGQYTKGLWTRLCDNYGNCSGWYSYGCGSC